MAEDRGVEHMDFSGSGTKTITVDSDEYINFYQLDISIDNDTTIEVTIGSQIVFHGNMIATAAPVQLFFIDFGNGRGTGVKGDNLNVALGDSGHVFVVYKKINEE